MGRIAKSSLLELNRLLDAEDVLSACDAKQMRHCGNQLRSFCPIHGSDHQQSLAVSRADNLAICHNTGCPANEGGTLLWLYGLAKNLSIRRSAEYWAGRTGFHLEYERPRPPVGKMRFWERAWRTSDGAFHRNVLRHSESRDIRPPTDECFESIFCYEIGDIKVLREALRKKRAFMYGPFFTDFDNPWTEPHQRLLGTPFERVTSFDEGVEVAREDLLEMVRSLVSIGVPESAILTFFSGSGFHLEVDARVFGVEPSRVLNTAYREVALSLAGVRRQEDKIVLEWDEHRQQPGKRAWTARLQTLDQQVYTSNRLWRCPNSTNSKSGYRKILLSLDELREWSVSKILCAAQSERTLKNRVSDFRVVPTAREFLAQLWKQQKGITEVNEARVTRSWSIPGHELVWLDREGRIIAGNVEQELADAAASLARKAGRTVVVGVQKAV